LARLTGAIHVYGGDFFAVARSEWDPRDAPRTGLRCGEEHALFRGGEPGLARAALGLAMNKLPTAILFDLDDTILAAFGQAEDQWRRVIAAFIEHLAPHPPADVVAAIQAYSRHLWSDAARHKDWRPRIVEARRHIVAKAFAGLAGAAGRPVPPSEVCNAIADRFNELHDAELRMFPRAHETLDR